MFAELTRPRQRPVTNVVAVLVMALTFLPIVVAHYISLRSAGELDKTGEER